MGAGVTLKINCLVGGRVGGGWAKRNMFSLKNPSRDADAGDAAKDL